MIKLGSHFSSNDRSRHSEWLRQRQWFIKAKQNHRQRIENADNAEEQFLAVASSAIVATDIQIKAFEKRLDQYEARLDAYEAQLDAREVAITEALMENQLELDKLYALREEMLANAYVLEDGRRVFKSVDGVTVYDEFHAVVGTDVVNPDDIPDYLEKYETHFLHNKKAISRFEGDRANLHKALEDIDASREKISVARDKLNVGRTKIEDGNLTVQDMEEVDADVEAAMPAALPALPASAMKHLSGIENASNAPDAGAMFSAKANPGNSPFPLSASPTIQPEMP